jgi:hypothetical protein
MEASTALKKELVILGQKVGVIISILKFVFATCWLAKEEENIFFVPSALCQPSCRVIFDHYMYVLLLLLKIV